MIILHETFLEGEFLLWGETPGEPATSVVRKPRSKNHLRAGPANPSPLCYDAGVEKLSSVLKEIGFDFKVIKKSTRPMIAWLPTLDNQPVSSSPLIGEFQEFVRKATLVPWKVTGFRLPIEKAIEFLCRSTGKQILGPGMIVGKDLTFWAIALRFAAAGSRSEARAEAIGSRLHAFVRASSLSLAASVFEFAAAFGTTPTLEKPRSFDLGIAHTR